MKEQIMEICKVNVKGCNKIRLDRWIFQLVLSFAAKYQYSVMRSYIPLGFV
jgi:hypothetical protein